MRITLLPHAVNRMEERGISEEEVRAVLEHPDLEDSGKLGRTVVESSQSEDGRSLALRVICNRSLEDERVVLTVELGRPTTRPPEGDDA